MSFMFNPYPYDDCAPVNKPGLSGKTENSVISGTAAAAEALSGETAKKAPAGGDPLTVCMDGYATAEWERFANLLSGFLTEKNILARVYNAADCYKSREELDDMLAGNLPLEPERDPVALFGKLFEGGYESLFDPEKVLRLKRELAARPAGGSGQKVVNIVYGAGACSDILLSPGSIAVYFDVTPKQAVLRIKDGRYRNLGDKAARPFRQTMRRCYYFDFELAMGLRKNLLEGDRIDFYIASDDPGGAVLIPKSAFNEICASAVKYPFRCKPVYLEGVWGGQYVKRLRGLPAGMKNCAWVFDLIPLEVSLLVKVGEKIIEFPFFTFVCKEGVSLMGRDCVEAFNGYFPIRFNYDDTYHGSGNMSIQVHPADEYIKTNFNEHGRQDESYYIVAAGQGARTFAGLRGGIDPGEFIGAVKKSESDSSPVDYEKYMNFMDSRPGSQVLLPAGTVHASGRNQVVLEIGSLTVGSYTFKLYDYLRPDLDGKPRPIHTYHGERTVETGRTEEWVGRNLIREPKMVRSGKGWAEYLIGEHDLLYFSLYRYEFDRRIESDTGGVFHVLSLVDGEKAAVFSRNNPSLRYVMNYLDIVVVPAGTGPYAVENLGGQPVSVHKTCLKENFREYV